MKRIYWTFILNTESKDKAKKITFTIETILGNSTLLKSEIYWKDSSKFKIELSQSMVESSFPEILIEALNQIRKFSNSWEMELPIIFDQNNYEISGTTKSGISKVGIEWVSFSLEDN